MYNTNNFANPYSFNNYNTAYPRPTPLQPPVTNNGILWVQGIEGAKAFQLAPNSNVLLMDSDNDGIFYIKVSDNIGMCNLRVFKYTEVTEPTTAPAVTTNDMSQYVTKEELNAAIAELKGVANEQSVSATKPRKLITE